MAVQAEARCVRQISSTTHVEGLHAPSNTNTPCQPLPTLPASRGVGCWVYPATGSSSAAQPPLTHCTHTYLKLVTLFQPYLGPGAWGAVRTLLLHRLGAGSSAAQPPLPPTHPPTPTPTPHTNTTTWCTPCCYLGPGAWGAVCSLLPQQQRPALPPSRLDPASPQTLPPPLPQRRTLEHTALPGSRGMGCCVYPAASATASSSAAQPPASSHPLPNQPPTSTLSTLLGPKGIGCCGYPAASATASSSATQSLISCQSSIPAPPSPNTQPYLGPRAWGVGYTLLPQRLRPALPPSPLHPPSPQHQSSRGARGTGTCPPAAQSAHAAAGAAPQSAKDRRQHGTAWRLDALWQCTARHVMRITLHYTS
jgi:hypothetical protein